MTVITLMHDDIMVSWMDGGMYFWLRYATVSSIIYIFLHVNNSQVEMCPVVLWVSLDSSQERVFGFDHVLR